MTTTTNLATTTAPVAGRTRRDLGRVPAVLGSVAAALLGNLLLYGVGLVAGGSFDLTSNGKPATVTAATVATMTVVPLLLGLVVAAVLSLRWVALIRVAQVVGSVLALATIAGTVAADFDGVSTITLSAMHVVIAAVIIVGLEAVRRRAMRSR